MTLFSSSGFYSAGAHLFWYTFYMNKLFIEYWHQCSIPFFVCIRLGCQLTVLYPRGNFDVCIGYWVTGDPEGWRESSCSPSQQAGPWICSWDRKDRTHMWHTDTHITHLTTLLAGFLARCFGRGASGGEAKAQVKTGAWERKEWGSWKSEADWEEAKTPEGGRGGSGLGGGREVQSNK